MIKWLTILGAIAGVALAVYVVSTASHKPPPMPLAAPPSINPFDRGIAATGIVEARSRNVPIAAPEAGLVTRVFVEAAQTVKAGDPLFELDPRPIETELLQARAAVTVAQANLDRLLAMPRDVELPPLEAIVDATRAELDDMQDQYELLQVVGEQEAASVNELRRRFFLLQRVRARLAEVEARLKLYRDGAWEPDIAIARAELDRANTVIDSLNIMLERRTVRAPIDGTILKRAIEPGQFAPSESRASAMVMGDLSRLHIRARVDEEDLPRLRDGARGIARVRGEQEITVPLTMLRIEPLATPKTELSGSTIERVDTRVVEVLFDVDGLAAVTLYPGQLVDVFIDAPDIPAPPASAAAAK